MSSWVGMFSLCNQNNFIFIKLIVSLVFIVGITFRLGLFRSVSQKTNSSMISPMWSNCFDDGGREWASGRHNCSAKKKNEIVDNETNS